MVVIRDFILFQVRHFRRHQDKVTTGVKTRFVSFVRGGGKIFYFYVNGNFSRTPQRKASMNTTIPTSFDFVVSATREGANRFFVRHANGETNGTNLASAKQSRGTGSEHLYFQDGSASNGVLGSAFLGFYGTMIIFVRGFHHFFRVRGIFTFLFPQRKGCPFRVISYRDNFHRRKQRDNWVNSFFFRFLFVFVEGSTFFRFLPMFFHFHVLEGLITRTIISTLCFLPRMMVTLLLFRATPRFPICFHLRATSLCFFVGGPTGGGGSFRGIIFFRGDLPSYETSERLYEGRVDNMSQHIKDFRLLRLLVQGVLLNVIGPFGRKFRGNPSMYFPAGHIQQLSFQRVLRLERRTIFFSRSTIGAGTKGPFHLCTSRTTKRLRRLFCFCGNTGKMRVFFLQCFRFSVALRSRDGVPIATTYNTSNFGEFFSPSVRIRYRVKGGGSVTGDCSERYRGNYVSCVYVLIRGGSSCLVVRYLYGRSALLCVLPRDQWGDEFFGGRFTFSQ